MPHAISKTVMKVGCAAAIAIFDALMTASAAAADRQGPPAQVTRATMTGAPVELARFRRRYSRWNYGLRRRDRFVPAVPASPPANGGGAIHQTRPWPPTPAVNGYRTPHTYGPGIFIY